MFNASASILHLWHVHTRQQEEGEGEGAAKRVFVVSERVLKSVPRCLKSVIIITGVPASRVGRESQKVHAHLAAAAPVPHPCMDAFQQRERTAANPAVQTNYTPVTLNHTVTHGDLIAGRGRTSAGSFPTKDAHCLRPREATEAEQRRDYILCGLQSIVSVPDPRKGEEPARSYGWKK